MKYLTATIFYTFTNKKWMIQNVYNFIIIEKDIILYFLLNSGIIIVGLRIKKEKF